MMASNTSHWLTALGTYWRKSTPRGIAFTSMKMESGPKCAASRP